MKHLAKDVYVHTLDEYNIVLKRKSFVKEGDNKGKEAWTTLGYYSNWEKVVIKLKDLGYIEWINGDVAACRNFINEACDALPL